jgi:hypothetical protein
VDLSGETYSVRGHGHGKEVDDLTPPVRFEHIAREKTVVDGCHGIVSTCMLHVRRSQSQLGGCVNIQEYLYSFSLGSWDWRMYTIFAAVLTVQYCTVRRVQSRVVGLSVAKTRCLFCVFSLAAFFHPTESQRGDVSVYNLNSIELNSIEFKFKFD